MKFWLNKSYIEGYTDSKSLRINILSVSIYDWILFITFNTYSSEFKSCSKGLPI